MDEATHAKFVANLLASEPARHYVGALFRENGHEVVVPKLRIAKTHLERGDFSDGGDLLVTFKGHTAVRVIEVKVAKKASFTCKEDWPFPDVFIEGCSRMAARGHAPYAFFILSKDWGAAFVINVAETRARWHQKDRRNHNTGSVDPAWCADLADVKLFKTWRTVQQKAWADDYEKAEAEFSAEPGSGG